MSNKKVKELLKKYASLDNILPELEGDVNEYGQDVILQMVHDAHSEFEDDLESRREWENKIDEGLELAKMTVEEKDYPWPGASSLKHPVTATACINFAAYTFPEVIRNDKVLEIQAVGYDYEGKKEALASRLTQFGNYQLLVEDRDWAVGFRKLLAQLPAQGVLYEKVYWDPVQEKIISEVCGYKEIIINHYVKSFDKARRVSHIMIKHRNEIVSKIRQDIYTEVELDDLKQGEDHHYRTTEYTEYVEDNEYEVIEQHKWLDLDGDGFEEPYILTFLTESKQALRLKARYTYENIKFNKEGEVVDIDPEDIFVPYHYIYSPDGCYHSLSIAALLLPFNKGINAVLNQLINAGTLATTQGGFLGRGARLKGGRYYLEPGEWIKCDSSDDVDLRKSIMPLDYKEPSNVLFQLLGFLVDSAKEVSSITDVMTGKQNAQNVQATTIQILAEKGLKVFSDIQRGLYDSLSRRFEIQFKLTKKHISLDKYKKVLDYMQDVSMEDFNFDNFDVRPVANPNLSSDVQRQARAQTEMGLLELPVYQSDMKSQTAIIKGFLEANNSTNIESKLPAQQQQQPPNPELLKVQMDGEVKKHKGNLDEQKHQLNVAKFQADTQKQQAEIQKIMAEVQKIIGEAQNAGSGGQMEQYKQQLEMIKMEMEHKNNEAQRHGEMKKLDHDMVINQMEFEHKKADRENQMQMSREQMNMQRQTQQENLHFQHKSKQLDLDHQSQVANQQAHMQQNQMGMDMQKHQMGLESQQNMSSQKLGHDQHMNQSKMDQDRYKHDSQLAYDQNNSQEQRTHDRDIEQQRSKQAAKRPHPNVGQSPSK